MCVRYSVRYGIPQVSRPGLNLLYYVRLSVRCRVRHVSGPRLNLLYCVQFGIRCSVYGKSLCLGQLHYVDDLVKISYTTRSTAERNSPISILGSAEYGKIPGPDSLNCAVCGSSYSAAYGAVHGKRLDPGLLCGVACGALWGAVYGTSLVLGPLYCASYGAL